MKAWMGLNELNGHRTPHCFKFIKISPTEPVKMFFRRWSSDPWCDKEDAVSLLKVRWTHINQCTVHGVSDMIIMNTYRIFPLEVQHLFPLQLPNLTWND